MTGETLKAKRKERGWTQSDLAKLIGVSKGTIINYEKGNIIPESKTAILDKVLSSPITTVSKLSLTDKKGIIDDMLLRKAATKENPAEFLLSRVLSKFHPTEILHYLNEHREDFVHREEFKMFIGNISRQDEINSLKMEIDMIKKKVGLD